MLLVLKFGGTSVAGIARIRSVAKIIKRYIEQGNQVIVIVSAMSGTTDNLVADIREFSPIKNAREYDAIVSTGEQISAGLMVHALEELSFQGKSFNGSQIPIITDSNFGNASILEIKTKNINSALKNNIIPIITGFQGIDKHNNVTTLGRGGSDTTAVALKADKCYIYTDIDGVYTADPRIVREAKKIDSISFDEMIEMSSAGAEILQSRSVELARVNNINLCVLSSFSNNSGTLVYAGEDKNMKKVFVRAIISSKDEAEVSINNIKNPNKSIPIILNQIASKHIDVNIITHLNNSDNLAYLSLSILRGDVLETMKLLKELQEKQNKIAYESLNYNDNISRVSIIGSGMSNNNKIIDTLFKVVKKENINIKFTTTSDMKLTTLVDKNDADLLVNKLHEVFELDK